jgi:YD repeat-containing protein
VTVAEMIADGLLERVERDADAATSALEEASRHVEAALLIREIDANGAYQLAYDGARKAIAAHMRNAGVRVRRGEGAHVHTGSYAAAAIDLELGQSFERMRRRRNQSEYGSAYFEAADVVAALDVAQALIAAVRG